MSKNTLSPKKIIQKAERACQSARTLLADNDQDGAVNRAYYAMFDAARRALRTLNAPVNQNDIRSHAGLIVIFGEHIVKKGFISEEIYNFLVGARTVRGIADYSDDSVEFKKAQTIVDRAETFVAAIKNLCMPDESDDDDSAPGY